MNTPGRPLLAMLFLFPALVSWSACRSGADHAGDAEHAAASPGSAEHPHDTTAGTAPLKEMMAGLGDDMDRITRGLWKEDFEQIAAGAHAIATHPRVTDAERAQIAAKLGDDFPVFARTDHEVHESALLLQEKAAARDLEGVLEAYGRVQRGCVSCHSRFRQRILAPE